MNKNVKFNETAKIVVENMSTGRCTERFASLTYIDRTRAKRK